MADTAPGAGTAPAAGPARWRALARRDGPLFALLAAFLLARLVIWRDGRVFTAYDSISYRGADGFDFATLVSFTGHAPRLWGTPLFYALFGTDGARVFGQWALATVAWAGLAWAVWGVLRGLAAKLVGAGGVLVLALCRPVTNWDFAVLSESLSISLGVATLAFLIRWLAGGSRWALAGMLASAVWWTFTRPDISVLIILLLLVLVVLAWRLRARRRGALVASGVLAATVAWCSVITPISIDTYVKDGWIATSKTGYAEGLLVYQLRLLVLPDPAVKEIFVREYGMPTCPATDAIATGTDWRTIEFFAAYTNECPELRAWGEAQAGRVYLRFAVDHPVRFAGITQRLMAWSLGGATYAKVPAVIPAPAEKVLFPPWRSSFALLSLAFAVLVAVVLVLRGRRRHGLLTWLGILTGLATGASAFAGTYFGAGEYNRFGMQEAVGARLAVILLFAAAVDLAVERVRRTRSNTGPEPADVMEYPHTPEDPPAEAPSATGRPVATGTAADTQTREG
jgi:hypothetical protein